MSVCASNRFAYWLCLASFVALGWSASAQPASQASKPDNSAPAASGPADGQPADTGRANQEQILGRDLDLRNSASDFNAPRSLFGSGPSASFDRLPGGPQPIYPNANSAQWQKMMDQRKNWTLMTPAQILGVSTPAEILGVADPDEDPNLTPEERFLQRQERQNQRQPSGSAATNLLYSSQAMWHSPESRGSSFQPLDSPNQLADPNNSRRDSQLRDGERRFSSLLSARPEALSDMNEKSVSSWASPFDTGEQLSKPTPAQLEGMDRFRALMDPPAPPKTSAAGAFQTVAATPDPFMQAGPAFNPAGRSFTPLGNDSTRPVGLTPLSGISGPPPARRPAPPLTQPPPWMSPSAQLSTPAPMTIEGFSPPQRQF